MSLQIITQLSNRYGADPAYVLAGGGNTSFKDEKYLYVKPSGVSLAKITAADFVKLERSLVRDCFSGETFATSEERESKIKRQLAFAVISGARPSVEAPMHEIMPTVL